MGALCTTEADQKGCQISIPPHVGDIPVHTNKGHRYEGDFSFPYTHECSAAHQLEVHSLRQKAVYKEKKYEEMQECIYPLST